MRNKKVCLVSRKYPPDWAGVANSASRLVRFLVEEGMEVHVVVPSDPSVLGMESNEQLDIQGQVNSPEVDAFGAYIYRISVRENELVADILEFLKILDLKIRFDIFHGYWLPLAFPCLIVSGVSNRPVIASIRGNDAFKEGALPQNISYVLTVLKKADWITSVCSDLLEGMQALSDISSKSSVILNGIDGSNSPQWQGFSRTKGVVGTFGELRFKKAIPDFLKAYSLVPKDLRKKVVLCGSFSDKNGEKIIRNLVSERKLTNEFESFGYLGRSELFREVSKFGVYVISSYHDGLPNALLEAASCGIPIVATNVGGMRDILIHEENALLVEPYNIESMANAISRVLSDEDLANKLSRGARILANCLDFDQEKNSWISVYSRLLAAKSKFSVLISKQKYIMTPNVCDVRR